MAFKRSAVRSRLSPPEGSSSCACTGCFCFAGILAGIMPLTSRNCRRQFQYGPFADRRSDGSIPLISTRRKQFVRLHGLLFALLVLGMDRGFAPRPHRLLKKAGENPLCGLYCREKEKRAVPQHCPSSLPVENPPHSMCAYSFSSMDSAPSAENCREMTHSRTVPSS